MKPDISGSTRLAAVVGSPISHSLSPAIHNAGFSSANLDWVYTAFDAGADQAAQVVEAMRVFNLGGLSVTMPLKAAIASCVDELTVNARALQSCNCVYWSEGKLVGDSTDGKGFVRAFEAELNMNFDGLKVMVLGAGGSARSIVEALGHTGVEQICVVNRSLDKAESAALLASQAVVAEQSRAPQMDVIVNTTPVGMEAGPDPDGVAIGHDLVLSHHIVVDIVYNPLKTKLIELAEAKNARVLGGVPMLVHQAALAFELWTGAKAPFKAMYGAVGIMMD